MLSQAGEPTVQLFRGEGRSATPEGYFYSDAVKEALKHADDDPLRVFRLEVPKSVAEQARQAGLAEGHFGSSGRGAYLVPDEWAQFRRQMTPELAKSLGIGSISPRMLGLGASMLALPLALGFIQKRNPKLGELASGAATGAGLGSWFGAPGALVGGGIGALASQLF